MLIHGKGTRLQICESKWPVEYLTTIAEQEDQFRAALGELGSASEASSVSVAAFGNAARLKAFTRCYADKKNGGFCLLRHPCGIHGKRVT